MAATDTVHEYWLERYGDQVGRARDDVTTPALLLDLDIAKRNIEKMAENFRDLPASLRPLKTRRRPIPQLYPPRCPPTTLYVK